MVAEVTSAVVDGRQYSNFRFSYDESLNTTDPTAITNADGEAVSPRKQVHQLQERLDGWVYQIPGFKFEVLTATLDDYTRKVETD